MVAQHRRDLLQIRPVFPPIKRTLRKRGRARRSFSTPIRDDTSSIDVPIDMATRKWNGGFGSTITALPGMSISGEKAKHAEARCAKFLLQRPIGDAAGGLHRRAAFWFARTPTSSRSSTFLSLVVLVAAAAAISAVALSATSLSLVGIIIIDGAESTFSAIITLIEKKKKKKIWRLTRERASADDVDVKANIIIPLVLRARFLLGELKRHERVFVTTTHAF